MDEFHYLRHAHAFPPMPLNPQAQRSSFLIGFSGWRLAAAGIPYLLSLAGFEITQ
jgi:hypothetical protein